MRGSDVMFLTDDNRRISGTEVKRKIRSKSSTGNLSASDGRVEADIVSRSDVGGCECNRRRGNNLSSK